MASFKLSISDPKTGKTYQKEVKDAQAQPFIGLNIGENIKGELVDLAGYELQITGGSDFCGFPMRKGILGIRKRITIGGGVGIKHMKKGAKRRKTVCGHKINENIVQINVKVTKQGSKKLTDALGIQEKPKEGKEEKPKEEKKPEPKKEEVKEKPIKKEPILKKLVEKEKIKEKPKEAKK